MNARMEKHLERVKFLREAEAAAGDLESRIAFCKAYLEKHAPVPKPQPSTLSNEALDLLRRNYVELDDYLNSNDMYISAPDKNNLIIKQPRNYWHSPLSHPKTEKFTASFTIPEYLYQNGDAETIRNEEYYGLKRSMENLITPMIKAGCLKIDNCIDYMSCDKIHTISIEAAVLKDKP